MKLAILGTRGIPARYGGFETFAEELSTRLVQSGFSVTVFCPSQTETSDTLYKGVTLRHVKLRASGGLGQMLFDIESLWKARRGFDVVYLLGYAASFLCFVPRLYGSKMWVNPDGLEWKRAKWNLLQRSLIKVFEMFSTLMPSRLVCDCKAIEENLRSRYARVPATSVIAYGTDLIASDNPPSVAHVEQLGLIPGKYFLLVCRLEPENKVAEIVEGFVASNQQVPLVLITNEPDAPYTLRVRGSANGAVRFLGTIYDREKLRALRYHCFGYFHGHTVGGTNPTLLESMGAANAIIAHDNEFNREVLADTALYFRETRDIPAAIEQLYSRREELQRATWKRAASRYTWRLIADQYADLLASDCGLESQDVTSAARYPRRD